MTFIKFKFMAACKYAGLCHCSFTVHFFASTIIFNTGSDNVDSTLQSGFEREKRRTR
jgi:hypothetical protein